jgi:membrane associated rhomboid family serine protease
MIPISDENPTRTTPFVTYALIAINVLAYAVETWLLSQHGDAYVVGGYGLVPTRISADPGGEAFTIFTSMFMHGGFGHLASNMLFLWIFGDNVEDAIGHVRYLVFYLSCGVCAAAAQVLTNPASPIAMVGASGAIAGVLGAYLVLYPRAPITVFVFLFPISLPAWVVIGGWFALQVWGARPLGLDSVAGGVAVYAHIGGFLAGVLTIRPAMIGRERLQASRFTGFRNVGQRGRFGLPRPRGSGGSGLPGPGPGRWGSWR